MTTPLSPDRPAFKVGDYVLIAPNGIIAFKQPKRIRGFDKYKDGKTYVFFENEKTGVSVDDLIPGPAQTPPPPDDPAKGFGTDNVTAADLETVADAQSAPSRPELLPNKSDIAAHLHALFPPAFVQPYPDAWIEIAFASPAGGKPDTSRHFSAFELDKAVAFAENKNRAGFNIYVGAALRHGKTPAKAKGRASRENVLMASHSWADFDKAGDDARIGVILKENDLSPSMTVVTGRTPHFRAHLWFRLEGCATADQVEAVNAALKVLLGSDDVQDPARLMSVAGTVTYPKPDKVARGYITELVTLHIRKDAPAYTVEQLTGLAPQATAGVSGSADAEPGRTDEELMALLEASKIDGEWHNAIRSAIASMIGRSWANSMIRMMCKPYCRDGYGDHDLDALIDGAREKWGVPNEEPVEPSAIGANDVARLNKVHAILPIGGKTRVVTFGELDEFPERETIVMTQSVGDFVSLNNKYRHFYLDKKGELQSTPMGTYWIGSRGRRQYDGGMAFMPRHDGDVGDRLNLWRGFGVKAIKGDCSKFLDFMLVIICNGNQEHFEYLRKREATILQKRIRSEIALGLRTDEEGAGKGFYEKTMRRLLGTHAMLITNPKHIIGAFNPHLETLLRVTADEALFVANHEHRNALFSLITEDRLTIEHKGCAVYSADNYLNSTILSNAEHFVPISNTARRFFIPTVSAARLQDSDYFAGLQAELENGGYEALLYHLLHEIDLNGFNIRKVPQTEALRYQRDQSLPPLETWWCELLESGTLRGSDPAEPWRAVSNSYMRMIKVETSSSFGGTNTQTRSFNQPGLFDQARQIEPRLKSYTSDHKLGHFLTEMGCDNTRKVLRRAGWTFPPLPHCRSEWEKRYPGWKWRNPDLKEWQPEGDDFDDFE